MKKTLLFVLLILTYASLFAATTSHVEKDENGWRLFVNDEAFPVYGMVWSYTPVGEGNNYSLWDKGKRVIKTTIDTDMKMLSAMGVNMIRCFDDVPPEWIEYIYHEYGITTMVNNLLGRYGVTANGIWYSTTDYSDRYTQEELINMAAETALKYKDVDGVVMYMLGNESNYGLVWEGSEIQDLPTENQNAIKAGYLYDLLEKAMAKVKEIDPDRVVGFINGDVQNMELIEALCPTLEVFGVNVYRGAGYGDSFYNTVAETIDRPILITESGADAFNALKGQEDQWMQAYYFESQWRDIYEHAYGKGKAANILGAFIFEWMDEWWKIYQYKDLDIHNTKATWGNAGYDIDYEPGGNNMDEEWFGVVAQGTDNGFIAKRVPRAAYYLLSDIFKLDMYSATSDEIEAHFASLNMNEYLARGYANTLDDKIDDVSKIRISNASLTSEMYKPIVIAGVTASDYDPSAAARAEGSLTVDVSPFENLSGNIKVSAWTDAPSEMIEQKASYYNDYHFAVNSALISYESDIIDINMHYHDQMGGFSNMGDVFSLVPDQYDTEDTDAAPVAIEFVGEGLLSGFRAVAGTEIYDGANPQLALGYHRYFQNAVNWYISSIAGIEYTNDSANFIPIDVKASVSGALYLEPWVDAQLSLMIAGVDKIGRSYDKYSGGTGEISVLDTLGAQLYLKSNMFSRFSIFAKADYRGLVADTNEADAVSYRIYTDGGEGNRIQAEGGLNFTYGSHSVDLLARYRTPLEKALGRDGSSPFRVSGNKETLQFELSYVYDEEGVTSFYAWDREDIEGSFIAGGLAALYSLYEGETDYISYVDGSNTYYVTGSPRAENVFEVKGNLILNLFSGFRLAAHAGYSRKQVNNYGTSYILSTIDAGIDVRYDRFLILTDFTVDGLGPEQWQKDMGVSFPYQWSVDFRYGFDIPALLNSNNSVGIKWEGKTYGMHSTGESTYFDQYTSENSTISQVTVYYNMSW